jgi:putative sigma-54 modulation protein
MNHIITAKKTTVTDGIRAYVEKKFNKFDKYIPNETSVHTKIEVKDNCNRHKVEVTISIGKQTIRAEANDTDMYVAIDKVEKIMARLLRKRKERLEDRRQHPGDIELTESMAENEYTIVKTKRHDLLCMTAQDACEAMEMVGHPFYVYIGADNNNQICAVYKREDGTYGNLIYQ